MLRIIGDSHSMGLERLTNDRKDYIVNAIGPGSVLRDVVKDGVVTEKFSEVFASADTKALLLGNELYNSLCTRVDGTSDPFHDFDISTREHVTPRATTILPERLIRDTLIFRMAPLRDIFQYTKVDFFIGGPPPTRDQALIQQTYAKKGITDLWVADPVTRLHCWKLQFSLFEELSHTYGIALISPPEDTFDADGFLKPEFHYDGIHGNKAFNERFLGHILQIAREAVSA